MQSNWIIKSQQDYSSFKTAHIFSLAIGSLWQYTLKVVQLNSWKQSYIKRFKDKMKPKPPVDFFLFLQTFQILQPAKAFYYLLDLIYEINFFRYQNLAASLYSISPSQERLDGESSIRTEGMLTGWYWPRHKLPYKVREKQHHKSGLVWYGNH